MGFAAVGAVAILLGVGVYAGSMVAVASYDAQDLQFAASDARHHRDLREQGTDMEVDSVNYNPGLDRVRIRLDQTGSAVLDASFLIVLVDGSVVPIDTYNIEGEASSVWGPGQSIEIDVTSSTSPDQVAIVTQDGLSVYWRA